MLTALLSRAGRVRVVYILSLRLEPSCEPGMRGCLSVASNAAKALAAALGKPLVGVHHMVRPFISNIHGALGHAL